MFRGGNKLRFELCSELYAALRFVYYLYFIYVYVLYRTKIFYIPFSLVLRLKISGSVTPPPPQVLVT